MRSAARDDPKIVCPAVRVAVARGEEFDEAAADALAAGANIGRPRLEPDTDQHQQRRDLVGQ
jgi:hypothetical protein